ncbi:tRNA-guanine transglycosylase DpdA [Paenibacillus polymyxa]|uniref:Queuine/other tRNA-ribosyltransferase n=1 Tax=Paenibacillus polymyxa (strain SC2) TaxID=886882 RepID=E3EGG6_PAEPS|nr:tRNA-guanine transglycosylase DpdA [Paenibacillus polymyxa]ADO54194.1 queuine/other tRNA-ribosyltransferase [Paenibacillus polymyxa SC2]WPQ57117.1 tRNA-guanine transglycosylase DpdA [Paenibacillus polymyxa]CCC83126.1 queuine tRNA-ribosyltransferase tRNA-guanine transglycosylase; Guanine insertion enzyme [Paenibacillus polymyxa M1]
MEKRILVVTSCTGEKVSKPENQLLFEDFQDANRLHQRESELSPYRTTAKDMYTGSQHLALMEGINLYREYGGKIDVNIISAGYGLLSENEEIVPYEVTFNNMNSQTIKNWSKRQRITETLQERIREYDLVFFLLGDKYLQSVEWPLSISSQQRLFFFAGNSSRTRVMVEENYHLLSIGEDEAKVFRFGLIGIKGFLFAQLLKQASAVGHHKIWEDLYLNPAKVRDYVMESFASKDKQLTLSDFSEKENRVDSLKASNLLNFYSELFPVPDSLIAINYKAELNFFLPENDDRVDPNYDFINDVSHKDRNPLLHDVYSHQIYGTPQYDGLLVSKVNIDNATKQKVQLIKEMGGIHKFLHLPEDFPIMGDCGAFSYISNEVPPYTTKQIIDYYDELGINYGVSVDHLVVGPFKKDLDTRQFRYELTLKRAEEFIVEYRKGTHKFHPIGIIQGWDPQSFKEAALHLINLGYDYIAIGGLAREQSGKIYEILREISPIIPNEKFRLHLFGVARDIRTMRSFHKLGVTSFDSSSPLRRAWLGTGHNYHALSGKHYTAIRIPEAKETSGRVKKMVQEGKGEFLQYKELEQSALKALRAFSNGELGLEEALSAILRYDELLGEKREVHEDLYREVLAERPWETCGCEICKTIGIDTIVFRGNNRNRRRGFHNTHVYHEQVKALRKSLDIPHG